MFLCFLSLTLAIVVGVQANKLRFLKKISKVNELDIEKQFEDFIRIYNKSYSTIKEQEYRFSVFTTNIMYYDSMLKASKAKPERYFAQYSDLTNAELQQKHTGFNLEQGIL